MSTVKIKEVYFQGVTYATQPELDKLLKTLLPTDVLGVQANEVIEREDNSMSSPLLSRSKWAKFGKSEYKNTIQLTDIIPMPVGAWKESNLKIGMDLPGHHINVTYVSIFDLPVSRIRNGVYFTPVTDREQRNIYLYTHKVRTARGEEVIKVPYFRITALANEGPVYREQAPIATGLQPIPANIPVKVDDRLNPVFVNAMTEQYLKHQSMLTTFDLSEYSGIDHIGRLKALAENEGAENEENDDDDVVVSAKKGKKKGVVIETPVGE